jgi:GNAT superfamily N-acetyltransferase
MSEHVTKQARTDHEVLACHPVMSQLRPHLGPGDLLAAVRRMEVHGYRLLVLEEDDQVRALVGYRITEMLRSGRALVIDDFVTDSTDRSRGYGRLLHDRLVEEARRAGCTTVELDSAVHRTDAHRFYFRQRMSVLAFHFALKVPSSPPAGPDRK